MPRFPVSPYWSSNPNIPIYVERGEDCAEDRRGSSDSTHCTNSAQSTRSARSINSTLPAHSARSLHPRHVPEHICPNCHQNSRDTPIHCVSVAHPPAPPSYNSISPAPPPPPSPRHLTIPVLTVEPPRHWSKPQTPTRALQFDPKGRPNVRFRRNAFSPLSPTVTEFDEIDWSRKSQAGLGIADVLFRPDASPITPGTVENGAQEVESQKASNWAQRIEQKLWKYSGSRNVVKRWLLEIISWTLSAACMAGILIMLGFHQNGRIPKWPLGLTLNAYISVLSKVASAALLLPVSEALGQLKWSWFQGARSKKMWDFEIFDNASRGPWGSFLLLVRTKGRSLASLGAAVTIFALCLDPFFQQVVEYPEKWRIQDGSGYIPTATGYEPFSAGKEYQSGMENLELDQGLLGITYRFFYNNGELPVTFGKSVRAEVPLGCPNSNCTWPEYETLGIHTRCSDASDRVEFKCTNTTLDWIQNPIVDPSGEDADATFPNGTACGWWLKADTPLLMTGYDVDRGTENAGETLLVRAQPLYDIFTRDFMPGYQPKLNSRNPLAHVVIVSGLDSDRVHRNETPIANECMISWSAKTLLSDYNEGGYIENVTRVVINDTDGPSAWRADPVKDDKGNLLGYYYSFGENITLTGVNDTLYQIDNRTHSAIVSLFDDVFPSEYTLINSTDTAKAMLRYKQYKTVNPVTRSVTHNPCLYENISSHFDHMASAMTNVMRSAANNTKMVQGDAYDKESIVEVRWLWLTLPLGLLTLTGIFLLATIVRSSREHDSVGIYKTSAIATLLYGLPDDMSKKMTSTKAHGTPRAKAKEVKVKWVSKGGWRFSGNSISPTSWRAKSSPIP